MAASERKMNELLKRLNGISYISASESELEKLNEEYKEALDDGNIASEEGLDTFIKILSRMQDMYSEYIEKRMNNKLPLENFENKIKDIFIIERMIALNSSRFEEKGKRKEIDKVIKKAEINREKVLDFIFKREKEHNQNNQTTMIPKSNKNGYPWIIIGGMGLVIIGLVGTVIFLLTKKKQGK